MTPNDHIYIEGRKIRHKHIRAFLVIISFGLYTIIKKVLPRSTFIETKKSNLRDATHLKINNTIIKINYFYFPYYTTKLKNFVKNKEIRYFEYNFVRFFYDITKHKFILYKDEEFKAHLEKLVKSQEESNIKIMKELCAMYKQKKFGFKKKYTVTKMFEEFFFTDTSLLEKYIVYGENSTEQKTKSNVLIFMDIILSPIFLYTMAGVILWFNIEYEFNACIIMGMAGYSLIVDFLEDVRKKKEVEKMSQKRDVTVYRNNRWLMVPHTSIFPGDVISIDTGNDFVCDARVIKGEIIVDESFLTGETVPVYKNLNSANNIVYAGTSVMKTLGVRSVHENKNTVIPKTSKIQSEVRVKSIKKKNLKSEDAKKNKKLGILASSSLDIGSEKKLGNQLHSNEETVSCSELEIENTRNAKEDEDSANKPHKNSEKESRAVGVVVSTRFDTAKGRLVKNILMETPINFLFEKQCMQTITGTLISAVIFIAILYVFLLFKNMGKKDSFCYSIDLIFCIMSPTLPATIWIGATLAAQRLRKKNIRCNEAQKINLAGKSDIVVFDKTGTLTEEGLDVYCIDDIENEYYNFSELTNNINSERENASETSSNLEPKISIYNNTDHPEVEPSYNTNIPYIKECLAVCHSIYVVDNELVGDPLDIKMFLYAESTITSRENRRVILIGGQAAYEGPVLKELRDVECPLYHYQERNINTHFSEGVEVVRIFEFDNNLRRMSVITKKSNGKGYRVFVKGSPESIHDLLAEVPEDYDDTVKDHALDGLRVISLAYKEIPDLNISRNEAESGLIFIGLIVFANKLKNETKSTLKELNKVGIKTLMATGDNILTAVSVGRQAKIIDKFTPIIFPLIDENAKSIYDAQWLCIGEDGLVFDKIKLSLHKGEDRISYSDFFVACEGREYEIIRQESKEYFDFLLSKGVIFARMNPDQKKLLIEDLNNIGYSTVFCGDGANDCGALKSAHVGIALAENEASIASTFISTVKNISCVLSVIKEGRCALNTSYSRFQFMLLTCYIQFISLYVLSFVLLFLSDKQTAHFDILIVLPFAYFMTEFKPNTELSKTIPKFNLFDRNEVIRVVGHTLIDTIFIIFGIVCCKNLENEQLFISLDSFVKSSATGLYIFFITTFQVIVLGLLFSPGEPHRQNRLSNVKFILFFLVTTLFLLFLLVLCCSGSDGFLFRQYQFVEIGNKSKMALCSLILSNSVISAMFERFVKNNDIKDTNEEEDA